MRPSKQVQPDAKQLSKGREEYLIQNEFVNGGKNSLHISPLRAARPIICQNNVHSRRPASHKGLKKLFIYLLLMTRGPNHLLDV